MKIQLDLDNKIIRVEEGVNLGDFFETINKLQSQIWQFKLCF